jgi:hypothetical protein
MQSLKRYAGIIAVVCVALSAGVARAQTCHTASLREPTGTGFHVGFTSIAATFSDGEHGDYQGLIPTLGWNHPWVNAELALPWYRLERGADETVGIGDLTADVRVAVYRADSAFAFGPELAVSFPTGDADDNLGMGHVMAMPGVWARVEWEQLSIMGQLAWGRALASSTSHAAHAHHAGHEAGAAQAYSPIVNPMNMSEFEHALGLRYAVHPNLAFTGRWLGGVPLDDSGLARQLIGPGLQLTADALDASIEALVPIAGDPFDVRFSISFGAQL